jgi:hypothetical protein
MTRGKKAARRIRLFLLVLWILCLASGVCWLLLTFGSSFGAGLRGIPSLILLGRLLYVIERLESWGYILLVLAYLGLFFMTQWLFLRPRQVWRVKLETTGRPMKRSAIAAAFAVTLLLVGLLYSTLDLFYDDIFGIDYNSPSKLPSGIELLLVVAPLLLWCFWSIIFCIYWRQSDYYTWLGRVIRGLIAGSVLELFVAVPVYVTRQDKCYCARGSYAGLIFGATVLLWAFGPGVFLLFLRERQRRDKLLNLQENNGLPDTT